MQFSKLALTFWLCALAYAQSPVGSSGSGDTGSTSGNGNTDTNGAASASSGSSPSKSGFQVLQYSTNGWHSGIVNNVNLDNVIHYKPKSLGFPGFECRRNSQSELGCRRLHFCVRCSCDDVNSRSEQGLGDLEVMSGGMWPGSA